MLVSLVLVLVSFFVSIFVSILVSIVVSIGSIRTCLRLFNNKEAGIENKNYSGHSLRSGFATVSAESGADERSIMAMTGHKTTQMVRRYIREANLFKNNALNKIKI